MCSSPCSQYPLATQKGVAELRTYSVCAYLVDPFSFIFGQEKRKMGLAMQD